MPFSIAAHRPATILVVDDTEANRYAVIRTLEAAGFSTLQAGSGQEALSQMASMPDLVVLDVGLPDVDGFEVCHRIKSNPATSAVPVLHLSADFTSGMARAQGLSQGADAYLTHPFERVELIALVNALLRMRDAEAERLRERTSEIENRYRMLFDQTPLPMWVIDEDSLRYVAVNSAAISHYGYSREEFLSMRASELRPPSDVEAFERLMVESRTGSASPHQCRHRRKDGSLIDVEIVAHTLNFDGAPARLVIGKDVTAQRRADAALHRSERQLRAQFMALPVATYAWRLLDDDDFELTDYNNAALAITDGSIREMVGLRATTVFATQRHVLDAMRQALRTGRTIRSEVPYRMYRTGQQKDFVITYVPVQPDTVIIHTADETERRAAEAALRASETRFRALTENTTELIAVIDVEGNFLYANPGYERVLALDPATLVGHSALPYVHPEDAGVTGAAIGHLATHPEAVTIIALRVRHADGSYRMIEFRGENMLDDPAVNGIVVNGRDVTERREAHEELRFRASLLDAVEQAVIATTLDGTITYWNRFAERLYGWSEHEVRGRSILDIMPQDPDRGTEIWDRVCQGESWAGEFSVRTRHGRRVMIHVSDSPIFNSGGILIGVVGVSVDVSERRALEEQLRQSQKLEAVGKLAGGVAHDFNNLLTVIRGSNDFVRDALPVLSEARADVAEIATAVDRASGLTRQLLAFSRKQVLTPQVLDLNVVVENVERMLSRLIGEDIALHMALAPDAGAVLADRGQLEQVLMNLVVNARDAMPLGGALHIATTLAEPDDGVSCRFAEAQPGPHVMLSIRDTGHGMDRQTLEHAFEPFFTTKGVGHGTGLGLATVYGIVRQSGGCIRALSEPGAGAEFRIYLPRRERSEVAAPADDRRVLQGNERVLLVEDEEPVRRVARRVLEKQGYSVMEAPNGRAALELFQVHADAIDLVVTDTVMPEMGGRELVEELRRRRPGLPALYMSGYTDDEIVRRGVDPSTAFLQKPFTAETFGTAVREALDRALAAGAG